MGQLVEEVRFEDPGFWAGDVHATYAWLRREAPVMWYEPARLWALSRYEDVRKVSSTPEIFSAAKGTALAFAVGERSEAIRATARADFPIGEHMLSTDPPRHTTLRRLISKGFTPRMVAGLEARIREIVRGCVAQIEPGEVVDLVPVLSEVLPATVIADLLGVPATDRPAFRHWADCGFNVDVRVGDPEWGEFAEAFVAMSEYFAERVERKRREPGDDVISALLAAELDGERLSFGTIFEFCRTILAAGNDTTRCLLSGGALALAEHPEVWGRLRANPELTSNAVEEMLRYVTPIHTFVRTLTRGAELGGRELAEGDRVLLLYASANRDEAVWDEPDAFDVERRFDSEHLAFGWGPHFCLGSSLARLEARVAFEELLQRFASCEAAGPPERTCSTLASNFRSLPLRFAAL
jgi:cytochrome P450